MATNEASDGKRPARSAATTRRLFLRAPARRLSLLGSLGWAGAAPSPALAAPTGIQAGSSDGDTAIKLLSEVVIWLVLLEAKKDVRG